MLMIGESAMLIASIFAHIALGCLFSLFFVLYYIQGDSKWKLYLEMLIGLGGNVGGIFILDNIFQINDPEIRVMSVAACIFAFLILTFILLVVFSYVIRDKDNKYIIRLRDILLGKYSWINTYYESRKSEIDERLNISVLENRENTILQKENEILEKQKYISEETEKLNSLGKSKIKMLLPEKASIIITKEYIDIMPSFFKDVINCISELNYYESEMLEKYDNVDIRIFKSYLISIASTISSNIFNGNSTEIRIHFRFYNKNLNGYEMLIAVIGSKVESRELTFIPYNQDNMILKSYECKRALIRSINSDHDYQSHNYKVWKDYLTYTFYNLEIQHIPILSFGISVKNETRYKKTFYFLNYIKFEEYLQEKMESLNSKFEIKTILYGGSK